MKRWRYMSARFLQFCKESNVRTLAQYTVLRQQAVLFKHRKAIFCNTRNKVPQQIKAKPGTIDCVVKPLLYAKTGRGQLRGPRLATNVTFSATVILFSSFSCLLGSHMQLTPGTQYPRYPSKDAFHSRNRLLGVSP